MGCRAYNNERAILAGVREINVNIGTPRWPEKAVLGAFVVNRVQKEYPNVFANKGKSCSSRGGGALSPSLTCCCLPDPGGLFENLRYVPATVQGWCQEFSDWGLTLPTRGLNVVFRVL